MHQSVHTKDVSELPTKQVSDVAISRLKQDDVDISTNILIVKNRVLTIHCANKLCKQLPCHMNPSGARKRP